jgi:hypothetical protein
MYFINDYHEELFYKFLDKLGFGLNVGKSPMPDRLDPEYGAFAYLMAAVQKESGLKYCDHDGIYIGDLQEAIGVWSSGERALSRLALQLFNSRMDDITTYDVFYNLGDDWAKAAVQGIKIRYGLGVEE